MTMRDAYVEKLKARLDGINADIDKLEARSRAAKADAKIEHEKQLSELRDKRERARDKLKEVRTASDDAWRDLKDGAERIWDDLTESVQRAVSRFGG